MLETGRLRPVGGENEIRVDVRVVAATNRNLETEVREGRFREDLFYRLNVFPIVVPPLRERRDDILPLAAHFLKPRHKKLAPAAQRLLSAHDWPGNVRELRNAVLRAVAVSRNEVLQARDFPVLPAEGLPMGDAALLSLAEIEKRHMPAVIDHFRGNLKAAAESLQIARSTLYNKISEYDIE